MQFFAYFIVWKVILDIGWLERSIGTATHSSAAQKISAEDQDIHEVDIAYVTRRQFLAICLHELTNPGCPVLLWYFSGTFYNRTQYRRTAASNLPFDIRNSASSTALSQPAITSSAILLRASTGSPPDRGTTTRWTPTSSNYPRKSLPPIPGHMHVISISLISRPMASQACRRFSRCAFISTGSPAGAYQPLPYFAMRSQILPFTPPMTTGNGF